MARFRSPKAQAAHAVSDKLALGQSRHAHKHDEQQRIFSLGTARNHESALTGFARFIQEQRAGDLSTATKTLANEYLTIRSATVGQKALDLDRQAISMHLGEKLERVQSDMVAEKNGRAYSVEQLAAIREHMTSRNALAVELCEKCGLRAHELAALRPAAEQPRSNHRDWAPQLHQGREGVLYSTRGKGGLVRELMVPAQLANRLEQLRIEPQTRIDRGIRYTQHYNVGSGQALSQSFSRASKAALGFSNGLHGTRHTFCQRELERLQASGHSRDEAKVLVSQLVGHFRSNIVDVYLR